MNYKRGHKGFTPNTQPCWDCVHAVPDETHGCSWSERLVPVKGWEAVPTVKKHQNTFTDGWKIINCPKFEKG